jgi:hypothetical protein
MLLVTRTADRVSFHKAAIMRRAGQIARFPLMLCRAAADRNEQRSRALRKAWAEAKSEAYTLCQRAEQEARTRAVLTERAAESVKLAAFFGNSAAAIRQAIASEHMRDRADFARIDRLTVTLSTLGDQSWQAPAPEPRPSSQALRGTRFSATPPF